MQDRYNTLVYKLMQKVLDPVNAMMDIFRPIILPLHRAKALAAVTLN